MEWDSERVRWYLDGEEYAQITRDEVEEVGNWAFDRPFYLILNLAMGGVLGGEVPDSLTYPQYLVVDWVRVFHSPSWPAGAQSPNVSIAVRA